MLVLFNVDNTNDVDDGENVDAENFDGEKVDGVDIDDG